MFIYCGIILIVSSLLGAVCLTFITIYGDSKYFCKTKICNIIYYKKFLFWKKCKCTWYWEYNILPLMSFTIKCNKRRWEECSCRSETVSIQIMWPLKGVLEASHNLTPSNQCFLWVASVFLVHLPGHKSKTRISVKIILQTRARGLSCGWGVWSGDWKLQMVMVMVIVWDWCWQTSHQQVLLPV